MSEQRKSLSHDALWNFVSTGTKAVSALVIFWLLARKLGTENYGVYTATLAVFLLTAPFVVVGSFHIVIRRVSRDRSLAPSAWGAALLPTFVFSFLASAIVAWLGSFLAPGMDKSAVFVLGLSEYLGLGIVYNATFLLQALNKYSTTAAITVVWSIARMVAAVIALVVLEPSFLGISVGLLIAAGVASVMASALAWREAGPPTFSFKESVTLSGQGMPFSFSSTGSSLLNDLDKQMLLQIKGGYANGIYSAGNRILGLAAVPMFALLGATYPRFFAAGAQGGVAGTRAMAARLSPMVVAYSIVVGVGFFVAAPLVDHPWVLGPEYSDSIGVVRLMAGLPLLNLCGLLAGEVLTGADYQGMRNKMIVLAAAVNVGLNLLLIPLYSYSGAIYATYGSEAALLGGFIWWIERNRHSPARLKSPTESEPAHLS